MKIVIINSTAKFYISISYQKDLLSIDTRIFTPSQNLKRTIVYIEANVTMRSRMRESRTYGSVRG